MRNEVGLWINYEHAVIVRNLDQNGEVLQIAFNIDKKVVKDLESDDKSKDDSDFTRVNEVKRYNDRIISHLRTATTVLIMGPGEAKLELQRRLTIHGFDEQVVVIKTAGKMSDKQIVKEVYRYFRETQHGL